MGDFSNFRQTNWDVSWGGTPWSLGFVDEVHPDLKLMTEPITVGSFGKIVVGERVVGLEGPINVDVREVTETAIRKAIPWAAGSGSIPLTPSSLNQDLYQYAALLTLHPKDKGADVDEDLNLLKAVPVQAYNLKRDGLKPDVFRFVFRFFPDRAQLAASPSVMSYGWIGAVPA